MEMGAEEREEMIFIRGMIESTSEVYELACVATILALWC